MEAQAKTHSQKKWKHSVEHVRSNIRIHCETEPLIIKLLEKLNITPKEFDIIFSPFHSHKERRSWFGLKHEEDIPLLRLLLANHLYLLLCRSKTMDIANVFSEESFKQEELQKTIEGLDKPLPEDTFDTSLSPEKAIHLLNELISRTKSTEQEIDKGTKAHEKNVDAFVTEYEKLQNKFAQEIEATGCTLTQQQVQKFFKTLSRMVPHE